MDTDGKERATPTSDEMGEVAAKIFDAARSGEADILQAVIERGVPSNLRNERGDSLIMLAAYHGHADAVARLLARIEPDHIYVKDGSIYTTAGVTAGIDLSLVMIEEDFGRKMALDVAKYLIVYLRRAGGQSQFSPLLESQAAPDSQMVAIQQYMLDHLAAEHTLASLAERAPNDRQPP